MKNTVIIFLLIILMSSFTADSNINNPVEYTILFTGNIVKGYVYIARDSGGVISVESHLVGDGDDTFIDKNICPILPETVQVVPPDWTDSPWPVTTVFDGNTTIQTNGDGSWQKRVVDGDTITITFSDNSWRKSTTDGNTTTITASDGTWAKLVVDENMATMSSSSGEWSKEVKDGNTITTTNSDGSWVKQVVVDGIITITYSYGRKTIVNGNTTTDTWADGSWRKVTDDGITRSENWDNGASMKQTITRDGTTITVDIIDGAL